jgi:predicted nuclease of predicted toxin-antitoxin system
VDFVADESVDRAVYERLRHEGHAVVAVVEFMGGAPDPEVLKLASQQEAVLVTADTDFGELVFRRGQASAGVLLMRLPGLSPEQKADAVSAAVQDHGSEMHRAFSVVSPGAVRIRRVP